RPAGRYTADARACVVPARPGQRTWPVAHAFWRHRRTRDAAGHCQVGADHARRSRARLSRVHAEAIAILTDLERRFDTSTLDYGGVSYWPLCRQKIWGALMQRMVLSARRPDAQKVANTGPPLPENARPIDVVSVGPPQLGLIHGDASA